MRASTAAALSVKGDIASIFTRLTAAALSVKGDIASIFTLKPIFVSICAEQARLQVSLLLQDVFRLRGQAVWRMGRRRQEGLRGQGALH